jgi:Fe-S cluster assembly ATP-binding protein
MLKVEKLVVESKDGKKILAEVDFEVGKNEIHCLLGKNGSGKTSLAQALMGINSGLVKAGKIFFLDEDITEKPIFDRAKMGLTLAFQEPVRLEGLSVGDFLELGKFKKTEPKFKRILELLGLDSKILNRNIDDQLSGGERKRIELASVALMNPKLMILDEPDASLDIVIYNELYDLLLKLKNEIKCSILLITHREEAGLISDKATLIERGKIICSGKFRKVMLEYCRRSKVKQRCLAGKEIRRGN